MYDLIIIGAGRPDCPRQSMETCGTESCGHRTDAYGRRTGPEYL